MNKPLNKFKELFRKILKRKVVNGDTSHKVFVGRNNLRKIQKIRYLLSNKSTESNISGIKRWKEAPYSTTFFYFTTKRSLSFKLTLSQFIKILMMRWRRLKKRSCLQSNNSPSVFFTKDHVLLSPQLMRKVWASLPELLKMCSIFLVTSNIKLLESIWTDLCPILWQFNMIPFCLNGLKLAHGELLESSNKFSAFIRINIVSMPYFTWKLLPIKRVYFSWQLFLRRINQITWFWTQKSKFKESEENFCK